MNIDITTKYKKEKKNAMKLLILSKEKKALRHIWSSLENNSFLAVAEL
jgi:hypothetical protein